MSRHRAAILLAVAGCGAALAIACGSRQHGAADSIAFSHHVHTEQGLACQDCHGGLDGAQVAGQEAAALPGKPKCAECHDVSGAEGCKSCHRNPAQPRPWSPAKRYLRFSHEEHAKQGAVCDTCHEGAAHWPDRTSGRRPELRHETCASCHKKELDSGRCDLCHQRLDLNARRPKSVYSHEAGFFERHGAKARGGADVCAQCHDQSFCADCHAHSSAARPALRFPERVDRELIHGGDYMTRHVLEARADQASCLKCHGTSYCASCHERSGVGAGLGKHSPHPNDWVAPGNARAHGLAARRNIAECAACHDQGPSSVCLECHSPKGGHAAHNPHPPGWKPPVDRGDAAEHEMCGICHGK